MSAWESLSRYPNDTKYVTTTLLIEYTNNAGFFFSSFENNKTGAHLTSRLEYMNGTNFNSVTALEALDKNKSVTFKFNDNKIVVPQDFDGRTGDFDFDNET